MKRADFFNEIIDAVEIEKDINEETVLDDIDEWDSLAAVTTLALYKQKLGLNIGAQDVKSCKTIKDLLDLGAERYE